jgi:hypothetical protein
MPRGDNLDTHYAWLAEGELFKGSTVPISSKRKQRRKGSPSDTAANTMQESFEHAFAVIDAAATATLISGTSPESLQVMLSYAFLNVASRGRSRSDEFDDWVSDPNLVWEPILKEVLDYLEHFDGPAEPNRELLELEYLRNECKIKDLPLSELEERRHNNICFSLLSWLLEVLEDQKHEPLFLECAFFIQWFKVCALTERVSERHYLIVRQNPPDIAEIWDSML